MHPGRSKEERSPGLTEREEAGKDGYGPPDCSQVALVHAGPYTVVTGPFVSVSRFGSNTSVQLTFVFVESASENWHLSLWGVHNARVFSCIMFLMSR